MYSRRILPALEAFCRIAAGLAFAVIILSVSIQVFGRWGIFTSPIWTEELTRFAMLYLVAFGVGLSYRTGDLVNVDIVCEALPGRAPRILRLVSAALTAGLCAVLIVPAWRFTAIGARQTSPALSWRMDFIHVSVLILLALLGLFALLRVVDMVRGVSDGLPETRDHLEDAP